MVIFAMSGPDCYSNWSVRQPIALPQVRAGPGAPGRPTVPLTVALTVR
jgi:hypothetical protein